jgi:hypothetical protein
MHVTHGRNRQQAQKNTAISSEIPLKTGNLWIAWETAFEEVLC